jgi:succinyl-CoA synthetase beta subunit
VLPDSCAAVLAHWQVTIKGCTGPVNTFVVEPFVPHKEEYYLCIQVWFGCFLQAVLVA